MAISAIFENLLWEVWMALRASPFSPLSIHYFKLHVKLKIDEYNIAFVYHFLNPYPVP